MGFRDRVVNLSFVCLALCVWVGVAELLTTIYPHASPETDLAAAGLIGLACGLTTVPVFWLLAFAHHRRIALLGDWGRAVRRGGWVGGMVVLFVALRIQAVLSVPIAVFVIVLVILAELTLSMER